MAKKKHRKQQPMQTTPEVSPADTLAKKRLNKSRKICRDSARYVHGLPPKSHRFADGLDFDEARSNRRITATIGIMDAVKELVASVCPDIPEVFLFEEEWLFQNLILLPGYDYNEIHHHTLLAASLWILDQLRDEGRFFDACQLFPRDSRVFDELDFPEIWDTSHDIDSVMGMLWTIHHRNDDCTGLPPQKKKKQDNPLLRVYLDDYTAENLHRQNVPSRNRFNRILAMIPTEQIDRAVRLFEDTFRDLIRRIYASRAVYAKQEQLLADRSAAFLKKAESLMMDMKNSSPLYLDESQMRKPVLAATSPFDMSALNVHDPNKRRSELMIRARQMDSLQTELEQDQEALEEQIHMLWDSIGIMLTTTKDNRAALYGPEVAAIWEDYQIRDPYSLCFAFLYLVEENSDLPWVYGISVHLMELCASTLPWHYTSFDVEQDEFWYHYNDEIGEYVSPGPANLPKRIKVPTLEDWYAMDYEDHSQPDPDYRDSTNLAQILYELTGGIMPRNLTRYENALETLDCYGITGKKALHPLLYCLTFLGEHRCSTRMIQLSEELLEDDPKEKPEKPAVTMEDLQKQLQELQQENKQLRMTAYDAGREAREARKKLEAVEIVAKADRQELADLRELVFHQQEDIYDEEPTESVIPFPYTARQRIVVFGGHDSWAREIKPRLPNVRFIDRTMLPNAELIRRADVIWIQTNALSHAYFYKIIDEARKHRIPVRYFSYASAGKCAEQLAEEDLKN